MEIQMLTAQHIPQVVQLARQNFYECIKPFFEDVSMMQAFYEYVTEENLGQLMNQNRLYLWGAYEDGQLVGTAGMQSEGHITILCVTKIYQRRGIGKSLLSTMLNFAGPRLRLKRVTVSAMPAWSWTFFQKQGFVQMNNMNTMAASFVPMEIKCPSQLEYEKKPIKEGVVLGIVFGFLALCILIAVGISWKIVFGS